MRCGDLERYLEAFLDGRLGRSRGAVLRRHLALCAACRARMERLRAFERDTVRRIHASGWPGSVWEGLELDLVGSGSVVDGGRLPALPRAFRAPAAGDPAPDHPIRPRHLRPALVAVGAPARSTVSRLVGVLLVAMALGAVYQMARGERGPPSGVTMAQAYLAYRRDQTAPTLRSDDPRQVAEWLTAALGRPVPVPAVPAGFDLVGASEADLADGAAGVFVYGRTADAAVTPAMLFVRPAPIPAGEATAAAGTAAAADLHAVEWTDDSLGYTAIGPFPPDQLRQFQR